MSGRNHHLSRKTDLTLPLAREMIAAPEKSDSSLFGHIGTHFDVMDREFPLSYTEVPAVVYDVSSIRGRVIGKEDIDLSRIEPGMAVLFHTGFLEEAGYGTLLYRKEHPQLSFDLIRALIDAHIALIGIDAAGIRRGKEHIPTDQYCADHDVFVIENLCNLSALNEKECILLHTYPMNLIGFTGIPCRVIAERKPLSQNERKKG